MVAKLPHMLVRKAGDYLGDGRELPLENVTPELDARLRKFDGEWISQVRQFHDPTLDFWHGSKEGVGSLRPVHDPGIEVHGGTEPGAAVLLKLSEILIQVQRGFWYLAKLV
jgi:hypothetical protein